MNRFEGFFTSPFASKEISLTELSSYAAANLVAMISHNPGALFNERIAATTSALTALEDATTNRGVKTGLQAARIQAKAAFRQALPRNLARIHAAVGAKFGSPSVELTQVFGQGRKVFGKCRDEQLDNLLGSVVQNLSPLGAQVGPSVVADASGLHATWLAVHEAAGAAKAERNGKAADLKALRAALGAELFKNLLSIALAFPEDRGRMRLYCPDELLRNRRRRSRIGAATLTAGPYDAVHRQVALTMSAPGAEQFVLRRRVAGDGEWTEVASDLAPTNGVGTFVDTVPAPGAYEYQTAGVRGRSEGEGSGVVSVTAT